MAQPLRQYAKRCCPQKRGSGCFSQASSSKRNKQRCATINEAFFTGGGSTIIMLSYKGYTGHVEYDDEAGIFHGEVLDTRDVITFQGKTVDEIETAFRESIEDYLEFCRERREEPNKPFSGKLVLRMSPELHHKVFIKAVKAGKSLNRWISDTLESA